MEGDRHLILMAKLRKKIELIKIHHHPPAGLLIVH